MLSFDRISRRAWKLRSPTTMSVSADAMYFIADGRLAGYSHRNERGWRIEDGNLCLVNGDDEVTTRFTVNDEIDGRLFLSGRSLLSRSKIIALDEQEPLASRVGLRETFANDIAKHGWEIGEHSYGNVSIAERRLAKLHVGKYCSIAGGVTIALGNHRTDTFTSYPFSSLKRYWPGAPNVADHDTKGDVRIGNDVWIGNGAFISSGISIGDGAVIGGRSVVTRDIKPYEIVVGVPAKHLRYRFDEATRAALLAIRWWAWPDHIVEAALPAIMSSDIGALADKAAELGMTTG